MLKRILSASIRNLIKQITGPIDNAVPEDRTSWPEWHIGRGHPEDPVSLEAALNRAYQAGDTRGRIVLHKDIVCDDDAGLILDGIDLEFVGAPGVTPRLCVTEGLLAAHDPIELRGIHLVLGHQ